MKKLYVFIIALAMSSVSFAELAMQCLKTKEEKKEATIVECKEKQVPVKTCFLHGLDSGCRYKSGAYIKAQGLYWRAHNNSTPYAYHIEDVSEGTLGEAGYIERLNTHYLHLTSKWDPGFRAGIGFKSAEDAWDVYASWTYFHAKQSNHKTVADYSLRGFFPYYDGSTYILGHLNHAKGTWHLNYNMADLEVGKTYYIKRKLALRPVVAVEGGWINNQKNFLYNDSQSATGIIDPVKIRFNNDFWGVGPKLGINSNWHLNNNFVFFGNAATALLFGKMDFNTSTEWMVDTDVDHLTVRKNHHEYYDIKPTLQLALGFGWGSCFLNDKMFFGIDIAAEYNYLWDQTVEKLYLEDYQMLNSNGGAIDMMGITLGLRLDF